MFSRPSSRVSSVTPSHTPSTLSARLSPPSTLSTLSSVKAALCTVSVVKRVVFFSLLRFSMLRLLSGWLLQQSTVASSVLGGMVMALYSIRRLGVHGYISRVLICME